MKEKLRQELDKLVLIARRKENTDCSSSSTCILETMTKTAKRVHLRNTKAYVCLVFALMDRSFYPTTRYVSAPSVSPDSVLIEIPGTRYVIPDRETERK